MNDTREDKRNELKGKSSKYFMVVSAFGFSLSLLDEV
jgi:hypothetical protein